MSTTATIESIDERLARIERLLLAGRGTSKITAWVKAEHIMRMTGWTKWEMRRMRENGIIKSRQQGKFFVYNPDSVPAMFVKNPII